MMSLPKGMKIGDSVVLRAGTRVGMGALRTSCNGTINAIRMDDGAAPCYGVTYTDAKGKQRHTWIRMGD